MSLAEDDGMIKALPSDRANKSLRISVLPRRAWRGRAVTNAHCTKAPFENLAVDTVAVANEISRRVVPAAGFSELPGHPFGGRMRRHAQPQHLTSAVE